jgi:hypothetical protein
VRRGWVPGADFAIEETRGVLLLRLLTGFPPTEIDEVSGCLLWEGPAKTIEEMDAAVAAEAARRGRSCSV